MYCLKRWIGYRHPYKGTFYLSPKAKHARRNCREALEKESRHEKRIVATEGLMLEHRNRIHMQLQKRFPEGYKEMRADVNRTRAAPTNIEPDTSEHNFSVNVTDSLPYTEQEELPSPTIEPISPIRGACTSRDHGIRRLSLYHAGDNDETRYREAEKAGGPRHQERKIVAAETFNDSHASTPHREIKQAGNFGALEKPKKGRADDRHP